jgi:hypothetical protein
MTIPKTMLSLLILAVCIQSSGQCETKTSIQSKSISTAFKYSLYGTATPIIAGGAMMLFAASVDEDIGEGWSLPGILVGWVGITSGPGFGHAYAGRWWHLVKGTLLRSAGAALLIKGLVGSDPSGMGCWGKPEEECEEDEGSDAALIMAGGAIYLWSAIHDFRNLDDAVEKYNQKHGITMNIRPTYFVRYKAPGVVISVGF